ncbi:hypothetical protein llap_7566 [Limosa lapponica baueri]|uniref:Uncharacterized protein n=1 Tax=Limosa lapponica baueri TaxID=1758121 RepID=A0A2I0U7X9_LIMLA|nr:hypothetical protein llap_7566 [Limosa lapponica baueri]
MQTYSSCCEFDAFILRDIREAISGLGDEKFRTDCLRKEEIRGIRANSEDQMKQFLSFLSFQEEAERPLAMKNRRKANSVPIRGSFSLLFLGVNGSKQTPSKGESDLIEIIAKFTI